MVRKTAPPNIINTGGSFNFYSFSLENDLMIKSTNGTPAKTIHGTSEIVKRNVRWYSGREAIASPKK
jgi:hypothetical protein